MKVMTTMIMMVMAKVMTTMIMMDDRIISVVVLILAGQSGSSHRTVKTCAVL